MEKLIVHAIAIVTALALARHGRWCRWIAVGDPALASAAYPGYVLRPGAVMLIWLGGK